MTFTEFKKRLIDADLTLPKFAKLIKVSEKNLQSYKKKDEIPNPIAVIIECFAAMQEKGMDYVELIENLDIRQRSKDGGFCKKVKKKEEKKKKEGREKVLDSDPA